jgi:hypothetical protein
MLESRSAFHPCLARISLILIGLGSFCGAYWRTTCKVTPVANENSQHARTFVTPSLDSPPEGTPALQDILDKYVRELGATGRVRSGD